MQPTLKSRVLYRGLNTSRQESLQAILEAAYNRVREGLEKLEQM